MDSNKYIGIPFKAGGRDNSGLDCWGLVRLVYKEELNIELPSFSGEYDINDEDRISELIAQYREGWEKVDTPVVGDIALFKIFGETTHVGIILDNGWFLHVREGGDSVVENLENVRWNKRLEGYYRYKPSTGVALTAVPHPLKTQKVTLSIVPGTTLEEVYQKLKANVGEVVNGAVILVNGIPIKQELWANTKLNHTDVVEYRALAGKETVRLVALIALSIYAPQIALAIGQSAGVGAAVGAASATAFATTTVGAFMTAAVVVAGSALINAIAPIRPPSPGEDPGTPQQQYLLTGGANSYNPYGAIPVVLGKVRMTPPLGAKNFITFSNYDKSYLNMMLVWGYGPLTINENTLRVGKVPLADYELAPGQVGKKTLDRKTVVSQADQEIFDSIYGNDVEQTYHGLEMTGPDPFPGAPGAGVELPPGIAPRNSAGSTVDDILFNLRTGGITLPPTILPDEIYTEQRSGQ